MSLNRFALKVVLPFLFLGLSALTAWALVERKAEITPKPAEHEIPGVLAVKARAEPLRMNVQSQGVVAPRTEINLVAEVAGRVSKIHPAFAAGGFFKAGEVLVALDPRDYDFAVTRAEASVAEARKELLREQEEAEQAAEEWQALGAGKPNAYVLRKPHLEERRAKLAAAQADRAEARLRRERCELRAPFAGRVRDKKVDVGQYVTAGEALARLYGTDLAEIRLPITADQAAFLDLPLSYPDGRTLKPGPKVALSAHFGGKAHQWEGRIVRTEGALDDKTGMLYAVAEVRKPYAFRPDRPPLAVGLFVHADIEGLPRDGLVRLPASALRAGYQVYVVDQDTRLRLRTVEVLRSDRDSILVAKGIEPGERVMVSGLDLPVEGMRVRLQDADAALEVGEGR